MNPDQIPNDKKFQMLSRPIRDSEVFLEESNIDPNMQITTHPVPWKPYMELVDVTIDDSKLTRQDCYTKYPGYRTNIRTSNTVIRVTQQDNREVLARSYFGKRGLPLIPEITQDVFESPKENTTQALKDLYISSFGRVSNYMRKEENPEVLISKGIKPNGWEISISYTHQERCWIIGCQDSSVAGRHLNDVLLYDPKHYVIVQQAAKHWFILLDQLPEQKCNELKDVLDGFTIVGSLVGFEEDIIMYQSPALVFYSFVPNSAEAPSVSPQEASQYFKIYDLPCVKFHNRGPCKTWRAFKNELQEMYSEAHQGNLKNGDEGAFIYIMRPQEDHSVLSIVTVRNLEYTLIMKLKEKIYRFFSIDRVNPQEEIRYMLTQFEEDLMEFDLQCDLPQGAQTYFMEVASEAFAFLTHHPKEHQFIKYHFATFINEIMAAIEQETTLMPQVFDLRKKQIQHCKLKIEAQVREVVDKFSSKAYRAKREEHPINKMDEYTNTKQNLYEPIKPKQVVVIILPVGIPGMGKTFFKNQFQQACNHHGCTFDYISSEDMRGQLIDSHRTIGQQELNSKALFDETRDQFNQVFAKDLKKKLRHANQVDSPLHVIFVDKNHPPKGMQGSLGRVTSEISKNKEYRMVALCPKSFKGSKFATRTNHYPFSLGFLMSCIKRVQVRKDHPTLNGEGTQSMQAVIKFYDMFAGFDMTIKNLQAYGFHHVLEFPFTNPDLESRLCKNQELTTIMTGILENHVQQVHQPTNTLLGQLQILYERKLDLRQVDIDPSLYNESINYTFQKIQKLVSEPVEVYNVEEALSQQQMLNQGLIYGDLSGLPSSQEMLYQIPSGQNLQAMGVSRLYPDNLASQSQHAYLLQQNTSQDGLYEAAQQGQIYPQAGFAQHQLQNQQIAGQQGYQQGYNQAQLQPSKSAKEPSSKHHYHPAIPQNLNQMGAPQPLTAPDQGYINQHNYEAQPKAYQDSYKDSSAYSNNAPETRKKYQIPDMTQNDPGHRSFPQSQQGYKKYQVDQSAPQGNYGRKGEKPYRKQSGGYAQDDKAPYSKKPYVSKKGQSGQDYDDNKPAYKKDKYNQYNQQEYRTDRNEKSDRDDNNNKQAKGASSYHYHNDSKYPQSGQQGSYQNQNSSRAPYQEKEYYKPSKKNEKPHYEKPQYEKTYQQTKKGSYNQARETPRDKNHETKIREVYVQKKSEPVQTPGYKAKEYKGGNPAKRQSRYNDDQDSEYVPSNQQAHQYQLKEPEQPNETEMSAQEYNKVVQNFYNNNTQLTSKQTFLQRHKILGKDLQLDGGIFNYEQIMKKVEGVIETLKNDFQEVDLIQKDWDRVTEKRGWLLPKAFILKVWRPLKPLNTAADFQALSQSDKDLLNKFEDGQQVNLAIKALFYVPSSFVLGITFVPRHVLQLQDQFPVFELFMEDSQTSEDYKECLQAFFGQGGPFSADYSEELKNLSTRKEATVKVSQKDVRGFLVPLQRHQMIRTKTRAK